MRLLIVIFMMPFSIFADPWGKDADLVQHFEIQLTAKPKSDPIKTPVVGGLAEKLIGFHQTVITPIDGPRSHYLPSSSQYTLDAMRKYGFIVGFTMGCDRLLRENDESWVYPIITDIHGYPQKFDPVR
ncbi:MAG: membrane protein insertion efficiency factor YidD [Parachlamydiaceae bacterium]|nr:MAG: membrane protein insertion efficiency factor YidD [Parachlamydiaceae bacterium]